MLSLDCAAVLSSNYCGIALGSRPNNLAVLEKGEVWKKVATKLLVIFSFRKDLKPDRRVAARLAPHSLV